MMDWVSRLPKSVNQAIYDQAVERQRQLTKPPGSLGQLEHWACRLAALQGVIAPALDQVQITVFAADHGVAAAGVSAFPQSVTTEMVRNFSAGGAAISVLAQTLETRLEVVDVGTVNDPGPLNGVIQQRVAGGTRNFCNAEAMTAAQLEAALNAGRDAVDRAVDRRVQLFIGGEMGIANTTAGAAVACVLLEMPATALAGPGTGIDEAGVRHKAAVIESALARHQHSFGEPLAALRCLGGFEIAALTGAYLQSGQCGIPVLVDGFIATVAALAAVRIQPELAPWLFYAHQSAEPGYRQLQQALNCQPILDLNMRLGEGSGAAVALPLLRLAVALHNRMATFAEAGVSDKETDA